MTTARSETLERVLDRRVTRDVDPSALRDLLEDPPRATVAFVHGGAAAALPARFRSDGTRYLFAVTDDAPDLAGHEVVLVVDGGPYWFQLRGLTVRGIAGPADADRAPGLAWYAVAPRRVLAWDYGTVHEA
jgi:hypothetical protein